MVKGELSGSESLYIDGKVEGAINLPGNRVTVGRNGQVAANIVAREIVVLGKVRGNCQASDRVDIRSEGSLTGDARCQILTVMDVSFSAGGIDIRKPGGTAGCGRSWKTTRRSRGIFSPCAATVISLWRSGLSGRNSAAAHVLRVPTLAHFRYQSKVENSGYTNTRATIQLLLEHGALWRPDGAEQVARVRRSLLECEPDVTLELVQRLMKHSACSNDTIRELLRTPTMKKHVIPMVRKFVGMGFDVRTTEQKAEDERQKRISHEWALRELASRYNREEIYEEIWSEAIQKVAKKYNLSDVGLAKVCRKLNIGDALLGKLSRRP